MPTSLLWIVLDFKRSSGEDARALTAYSGGVHRFEKYVAMPLVFLDFTEKTGKMVMRIFVKDRYVGVPSSYHPEAREQIEWYLEKHLSLACQEPLS